MRRLALLVALATVLLAAPAAWADVLGYAHGARLEGTLQEVTFLVKGIPSLHGREDVAALTVSASGHDVLVLKDGRTLEGKLASVRFRSAQGHMALGRKEVKSVVVTQPAGTEEQKPKEGTVAETAPTKPKPTIARSPAQQAAIAKNKELCKAYLAKADEMKSKDIETFSKKHKTDWEGVNRDIKRLATSIDRKLWRRKSADRSYDADRQHGSDHNRLLRTDGLAEDQRELERARNKRSKLKKSLGKQRDELDERAKAREKKVKAVATGIQRDILAGTVLTEEQMTARYDRALGIKTKDKKKR